MTEEETTAEQPYAVVMQLHRWDRTKLQLSLAERAHLMATGELNLDGIAGPTCIGWVPVFETKRDAEEYQAEEAPTAQVLEVGRRFEEP